jgi:hypothetical protein
MLPRRLSDDYMCWKFPNDGLFCVVIILFCIDNFDLICSTDATQLVLTHFSNRYHGDTDPESLDTMKQIEHLAADSAGFDRDSGRVIAAYDFMRLDMPPHKELS